MAHNVESLIWQRYTEAERNRAKRWYIRQPVEQVRAVRAMGVYRGDACRSRSATTTPRLMRERFGVRRVEVVENGVDVEYFKPQRDVDRDPAKLLFLGSLDWRPNLDGVTHPARRRLPEGPRREIRPRRCRSSGDGRRSGCERKSRNTPGVRVFADVPDVRPFLATCGMLVVPLRIGGGSRLKILEALATETPVVSTRVGRGGIATDPRPRPDRDRNADELSRQRDHRRDSPAGRSSGDRRERSATGAPPDIRGIHLRLGSMKSGNPCRVVRCALRRNAFPGLHLAITVWDQSFVTSVSPQARDRFRRRIDGLSAFPSNSNTGVLAMATKWLFVAPVAGALGIGAGIGADQLLSAAQPEEAKQDVKPAVTLPITRVVMFNSGVGYFSRSGEVTDDARVDLTFPEQDINDLLKSMVLEDFNGGRIAAVSYDSPRADHAHSGQLRHQSERQPDLRGHRQPDARRAGGCGADSGRGESAGQALAGSSSAWRSRRSRRGTAPRRWTSRS